MQLFREWRTVTLQPADLKILIMMVSGHQCILRDRHSGMPSQRRRRHWRISANRLRPWSVYIQSILCRDFLHVLLKGRGYKYEDKPWRRAEDPEWDWKSTTSSDEAIGHIFAFGVIAELVDIPDTPRKSSIAYRYPYVSYCKKQLLSD